MADLLTTYLRRVFRARERLHGRALDPSIEPGTRGTPSDHDRDLVTDYCFLCRRAGVGREEDAALWARWVLEGRPGKERSQATAEDAALWLNRNRADLGPWTAKSVKRRIKAAEILLFGELTRRRRDGRHD